MSLSLLDPEQEEIRSISPKIRQSFQCIAHNERLHDSERLQVDGMEEQRRSLLLSSVVFII